jgi:hypothetical protein
MSCLPARSLDGCKWRVVSVLCRPSLRNALKQK